MGADTKEEEDDMKSVRAHCPVSALKLFPFGCFLLFSKATKDGLHLYFFSVCIL